MLFKTVLAKKVHCECFAPISNPICVTVHLQQEDECYVRQILS